MIDTTIDSLELLDFCEEHDVDVTVKRDDILGLYTIRMNKDNRTISYSVGRCDVASLITRSNWLMDTLEHMLQDLEANEGKEI